MKTRRFQVIKQKVQHGVVLYEIQFDGAPIDWATECPNVRDCLDAVLNAAREGRINPAVADEAREHYVNVLGLSIEQPSGIAPLLDVGPCGVLYTTIEGKRRRVYEGEQGLYARIGGRDVYLTAPGGSA